MVLAWTAAIFVSAEHSDIGVPCVVMHAAALVLGARVRRANACFFPREMHGEQASISDGSGAGKE